MLRLLRTGEEQLFNLASDPNECRDLVQSEREMLSSWRQKMVKMLEGRSERLSDGKRLIPGRVAAWRAGDPDDVHKG